MGGDAVAEAQGQAAESQDHGRADVGDGQMATGPAQAADGAGQDRFGAVAGFLAAQPEHRPGRIDRRDHAQHPGHRGQEGVGQRLLPAHPPEDLQGLPVGADQVGGALGDTAEDPAGAEEAERPAQHGGALEAPGQAERAAQRPGRAGRAGAGGQEAHPDVATGRQDVAGGEGEGRTGGEEKEHPPAVAGVGADVLGPADRRDPGERRRGIRRRGVSRGAQGEDEAEDRAGQSLGEPGALGELRGDGGQRGEQQARAPDGEAQGE